MLSYDTDGHMNTSLYDKRDYFNFSITNFPFLSSNIPSSPAFGVVISQLIRYARASTKYMASVLRARRLSDKLLSQGYVCDRLTSSLRKFYGRYGELVIHYVVPLSRMIPNIAVIGSGGGVRALTAMSSVFCTLYELDLLQYILYVAGLSGSTWYLTTLYSHKDWPNIHPRKVHEEIKERVVGGLLNKVVEILNIPGHIFENFFQGRPQNLTGIFGHSLSSNLIPDRYDTTWSNQRKKVEDGKAPFPILSCIHVKSDIPAKKFHDQELIAPLFLLSEWIEISPYEVAIPKYGVRLDTKYFGSKFNRGKVEEIFDEIPLHYINADGKDGTGLAMENFKQVHIDVVGDVSRESHYMYNNTEYARTRGSPTRLGCGTNTPRVKHREDTQQETQKGQGAANTTPNIRHTNIRYPWTNGAYLGRPSAALAEDETYDELDGGSENLISELLPDCIRSFLLDKRGYRAAWINNPLKNLSFEKQSRDIKTCSTDKNVGGMFKKAENKEQMCITDAGLAFNSPYPLVLRASRSVDLILSFDFTDRGAVNGDPFTEVRLAQTWAEDHKAKFPPVPKFDETQPVKELYILEDENDPLCPVIMHFVLINRDFKIFSSPGVKRQTRSDVRYAEFDLFEDKSCPYNCTNFKYTNAEFDKLSELVRFIVLNHEDEIKKQIKKVYGRRAKTT
ncbi:hypothetical protein FSP39_021826 [Pinctada imbricata]|uniref:PLA2c domain-containing protein n=1 Tax=Pinctada imbricata TaxID=66713 RepID=A0AA88Y5S1_PINIB|nr:hypothetical protein FSP39_021826 [Pinctada imbricata]